MTVFVDEAVSAEVTDTAPIIGRFVADVESAVAARAAGVVESVSVLVGDRIPAGAEIARLDSTLLEIEGRSAEAALSRAQAGVAAAQATARLRRQALDRAEQLRGSTAFSRGQVEDLQQQVAEADSGLARAEADVESARAALAMTEYSLTHTRILAPFDGVVLERSVNPGQYVSVGQSTAVLLAAGALEIEADVPTDYLSRIEPELSVDAVLANGARAEAIVRAVIPRESVATRTRPVRLTLAEGAPPLTLAVAAPGASVTLYLPTGGADAAVTAPKDALVQSGEGWMIFVVADGVAQARQVAIGRANGDRIEVLSGLEAGDLVVVRGNERLSPGQPVAPKRLGESPDQQG